MKKSEQKCGNCYHWDVLADFPEVGRCRETSPRVFPKEIDDNVIMPVTLWPRTANQDPSCGEWKEKEKI